MRAMFRMTATTSRETGREGFERRQTRCARRAMFSKGAFLAFGTGFRVNRGTTSRETEGVRHRATRTCMTVSSSSLVTFSMVPAARAVTFTAEARRARCTRRARQRWPSWTRASKRRARGGGGRAAGGGDGEHGVARRASLYTRRAGGKPRRCVAIQWARAESVAVWTGRLVTRMRRRLVEASGCFAPNMPGVFFGHHSSHNQRLFHHRFRDEARGHVFHVCFLVTVVATARALARTPSSATPAAPTPPERCEATTPPPTPFAARRASASGRPARHPRRPAPPSLR